MHLMNDSLEAFLAVCSERSFSAAATRLGVTQSAVTKMIARLEDALAVDLFDRSCRPIALTEEAVLLLKEVEASQSNLARTVETIRKQSFLKPLFRIGTIDGLSKCFLPSLIRSLSSSASALSTMTGTSQSLLESLLRREIDFAFVSGIFSEMPNLVRLKIFEEESVLLFPEEKAKGRKVETWETLETLGLPYLQFVHEGGGGRLNDTYLSLLDVKTTRHIEVDADGTMTALIAQGFGWTVGRTLSLLQNPEYRKKVAILPMPQPKLMRPIYLVARSNDDTRCFEEVARCAEKIFQQHIAPELKSLAPWIEVATHTF